jgi:uncharacterized short protein YbdD (DUF466 family)
VRKLASKWPGARGIDDAERTSAPNIDVRGGAPAFSSSVLARARRVASLVRRIIGAPDYDTYLTHVRQCHPDATPLTRDDFARQRLEDRYSRPGSRCC